MLRSFRIAEGKYLNLLYEVFREKGVLDLTMGEIKRRICPGCDLRSLCVKEKLCIDGMATMCLMVCFWR